MIKILMMGVLVGTSAFAQVKKPKANAKVEAPVVVQKHYLQESRSIALSEKTRLENALKAEREKIADFEPCKVVGLQIEKTYNDWFLDHYSQINELDQRINSSLSGANAKLEVLKSQIIQVNALKGQEVTSGASEVEVSFRNLIEYFKIFNGRSKVCSKDQLPLLKKQMENPSLNSLNLSHSQIVTAMQAMTTNLNASLKASDASYEISFSEATCGYSLELKSVINLAGKKRSFGFSLLENSEDLQFKLSEEEKWAELSKLSLEKTPIDGLLRYRKVINDLKDSCTSLPDLSGQRSASPYIKFSEIEALVKSATKVAFTMEAEFVEIPAATYRTRDGRTVSINAFEIQTTEVTQGQWLNVMSTQPSGRAGDLYCSDSATSSLGKAYCPNNPIDSPKQFDVQQYIQKLNEMNDGYVYRLPTDTEWEYAARGGSSSVDDLMSKAGDYAWYVGNGGNNPHPVAQKLPNAFGLYDMYGNVAEIVTEQSGWRTIWRTMGGNFYYTASAFYEKNSWIDNIVFFGVRVVRTPR